MNTSRPIFTQSVEQKQGCLQAKNEGILCNIRFEKPKRLPHRKWVLPGPDNAKQFK